MISGNPNNVSKLSAQLKRNILFIIEKSLCPKIAADLDKRAKQLPDLEYEDLVAEYMQSADVNLFKELCGAFFQHDASFQNLAPNVLDDLIRKYLASQINFAQCVKLEMDVITISQFARKYLGIDQAILLLKNIHDVTFDLNDFLAQLKEKSANNTVKFTQVESIIKRVRNFYFHADIKREYYVTHHLEQNTAYLQMLEALLWVNGQRQACIVGMEEIKTGAKQIYTFSSSEKPFIANPIHGARTHIENTIGMLVSDYLLSIEAELSEISVEETLSRLKALTIYQQVVSALDNKNGTRAGFDTYLAGQPKEVILKLLDDYLLINIHLAHPLQYERNIVLISQYLHQEYGIDTAIRLLDQIHLLEFDAGKFFADTKMPKPDILAMIQNINHFYLFADIKKHDNYFDEDDSQAKMLAESEMWISKQRHYCIQGMSLLANGQAHTGKQISFREEEAVKYIPKMSKPVEQPSELKKPKLIRQSSFKIPRPHYYDYSKLQQVSEEEALRIALQQSEREARAERDDDIAMQEAIERSRVEVKHIAPVKTQQELKEDLFKHCTDGNLAEVIRHIEELQVDVRSIGTLRNQPIHYAARNHRDEVMAYLIQRGANLNDINAYQESALQLSGLVERFHRAATNNDMRTMKSLLDHFRLPVDCKNQHGQTALHVAAAAGQLEIVRFLVEDYQANIDTAGNYRNKAIHYAAMGRHLEVMAYLISKGASPVEINSWQQSPHMQANLADLLCKAAETENYQQIRFLLGDLRLPIDIRNSDSNTALIVAVKKLQLPMVRFLVEECHANIQIKSTYSSKPIHFAASLKNLAIMEYLISKGASTQEQNAYQMNALDLLGGREMLTAAAKRGDHAHIHYLVTMIGVGINSKDSQNKTALISAAEAGLLETVRFLVETCLADISVNGTHNNKAIHMAAANNHEHVVVYLLNHGASLQQPNVFGMNAAAYLHLSDKFITAAMRDDVAEMQRYVEEFKVDVNALGPNKKSALMVATENGKQNAISYLLAAGANPIPGVSKPAVADAPVARSENLPSGEFTVLADAWILLDRLEATAKLRQDQKDDADAPSWGTTDAEEERYQANHVATVKRADTLFTQARFDAATTLLDEFKSGMRINDNGEEDRNSQLECMLMAGTQQISVSAKYNLNALRLQQNRAIYSTHDLTAPIALYPFAKLRATILNALGSCFTGWGIDPNNPDFLTKTVQYRNIMFYYLESNALYQLQKMFGDVEKNFDMKINHDNFRDSHEYKISVHKDNLQKVKNWIGYTSSLKQVAAPTFAEIVIANNSPIVARQPGGMVRSASMEYLRGKH